MIHSGREGQHREGARLLLSASLFRHRAGSVTLEFALVGSAFLLFVFMILEVVLQLATQATLDSAAFIAARQIRIGTITGSAYASNLTTLVCSNVVLIPSCTSSIQIYVAAAPSTGASGTSPAGTGFASIALATSSGGTMTTTKAALTADEDVILQLGYQRPFLVPWLTSVSGRSGALLIATMAFQTEPY
jgi:Flp pilus assembly protein TadG